MAAGIVRRYGQMAAAGLLVAGTVTAAGAVSLAEAPPALAAYGRGAAPSVASFTAVSLRVPAMGGAPVGIASAPEPTADSSALAVALALLGGHSSVPESSPALTLAGGLLAICMLLLRRGRLQS